MKKIILITGATAGIGRHTALMLAERGFHVIATGRRTEALAELKAQAKGRVDTLRLDVTDSESVQNAVKEIDKLTDGYGVDVLVNNAGFGMLAPAIETTDEDLRRQYETNVFGLMSVTRAFVPKMMQRGSGRVINVSSLGGRFTLPFFGAYNSTKYAIESLSDALRVELKPFGVQVSLIEPGLIKTEFADTSMAYIKKYEDENSPYAAVYARADEIHKQSEANAAGPEAVSRAILHAASARRPRVRYVAPRYYSLALFMIKWLPARWVDYMLGRSIGLHLVAAADARRPSALASA